MINKHVKFYYDLWYQNEIKLNKKRIELLLFLEKNYLNNDDFYFDNEKIENCIKFAEKYYFKLLPFQKFIIAFIFYFYKSNNRVVFKEFLILMGRGAGKNGLISIITHFLASPLHNIKNYNISIVANSEVQAQTSFKEIYTCIQEHSKLQEVFYGTKSMIEDKFTKSEIKFRTSNTGTKDGLRDGAVVFDEIHEFESYKRINVYLSGLGKVFNSRVFYITTNGFCREGLLDKLLERVDLILKEDDTTYKMFPFICTIDDVKEADDIEKWEKANPMLSKPLTEYAETLLDEIKTDYRNSKSELQVRMEFMAKRMNYPEQDPTENVASWEDIKATNREMPYLLDLPAIGGLDFASVRDFAAVGLLFKKDEDYIWLSHSFVRQGFLNQVELSAPIMEWQKRGLLTIVDEPTIRPDHIVDWFVAMREKYNFNTIVADTFRLDLIKSKLEEQGFNILYIRNPSAIHGLLHPRVETIFANHNVIFGDNPLMRWYTNNTAVKMNKNGNVSYIKKDEVRRKTDGFQAFVHALWQADNYLNQEEVFIFDDIDF